MFYKFGAKNFYSHRNYTELNFIVDHRTPNKESYEETDNQVKLSLIEVIVGSNAVGKTTILKAISFLSWLITESYKHDISKLPYEPFGLDKKKPTEFHVEFKVNHSLYIYSCTLNSKRALYEDLSYKNLHKKRVVLRNLFTREWLSEKNKYKILDNSYDVPKNYIDSEVLGNTSLISAAARFGHEKSLEIVNYWENINTNMSIRGDWIPHNYRAYKAYEYYRSHKDAKNQVLKSMQQYDIGIKGFGKNGRVIHSSGSETFEVGIEEESSGTLQLLSLYQIIDRTLQDGGLAIIDEFDAYLHPNMVVNLVERFLNKKTNPKRAQLLLSSHNPEILNLLDKQQIFLAEKDSNGVSKLKRLDTIRGVRADDNFHNKYLSGEYGGIPPKKYR
jgi:hypothetical protein